LQAKKKLFFSIDLKQIFAHCVVMRNASPLEQRIKVLKIGGKPIVVFSPKERVNAHTCATRLGYKIKTQSRPFIGGFAIYRIQ